MCLKCVSRQGLYVGELLLCLSQLVLEIAKTSDPNFSLVFPIKVVLIKIVHITTCSSVLGPSMFNAPVCATEVYNLKTTDRYTTPSNEFLIKNTCTRFKFTFL